VDFLERTFEIGVMKKLMSVAFVTLLAACQIVPLDQSAAVSPPPPPPPAAHAPVAPQPGSSQQWLFGSPEAEIALQQTWATVASYVEKQAADAPAHGVVLAPGSTPVDPAFVACEAKPLAAVFDADETLIWNLGAMEAFSRRGITFDNGIWDKWEKTGAGKAVATPGALAALKRIRDAGVTVIVNTNRSSKNPEGTEATLREAGVGDFSHGTSLFLRGDAPDGSGKDGRRAMISENYCVIALVGDQLGDIGDAFNAKTLSRVGRKELAASPAVSGLWGNGWFILPNPVYGPSIYDGSSELYPSNTHWEPPAEDASPAN
jgi:5'-nucleotidase (lipoprotein e(P4) family)